MQSLPWESVGPTETLSFSQPTMLVDLNRCIGCHACSVACKMENQVSLGEFRLRVRWLPRPGRPTLSFLPVFDPESCDFGSRRRQVGLPPACVAACPTKALTFGEKSDAPAESRALEGPPSKDGVVYLGLEDWHGPAAGAGAQLSPQDPDIIYEQ